MYHKITFKSFRETGQKQKPVEKKITDGLEEYEAIREPIKKILYFINEQIGLLQLGDYKEFQIIIKPGLSVYNNFSNEEESL